MIFTVETEERTLIALPSEAEAISYCEGLDVEAAVWLFWNDCGEPLVPQFSIPNTRGLFSVKSGTYSLVAVSPNHHAELMEALEEIMTFESPAPFDSADGIRNYLEVRRAA